MATNKLGREVPAYLNGTLLAIGQSLRSARERRNLRVRQTAEMVGISHPYVVMIENGQRAGIAVDTLATLADFYGLQLALDVRRAGVEAIDDGLSLDDREMLLQIKKLLPGVQDPTERAALIRGLELAAEREAAVVVRKPRKPREPKQV